MKEGGSIEACRSWDLEMTRRKGIPAAKKQKGSRKLAKEIGAFCWWGNELQRVMDFRERRSTLGSGWHGEKIKKSGPVWGGGGRKGSASIVPRDVKKKKGKDTKQRIRKRLDGWARAEEIQHKELLISKTKTGGALFIASHREQRDRATPLKGDEK